MNVELSRRVGRLMGYPPIMTHTVEERLAFVEIISRATNFEALPEDYQQQILQAERAVEMGWEQAVAEANLGGLYE